MNLFIILLTFTTFLYTSAQFRCDDSTNPCNTGGVFLPENGYQCIQISAASVMCTCPGGHEINIPCSLCNRSNRLLNVCNEANPNMVLCQETREYGTSYACLCRAASGDLVPTTHYDCDLSVTLATPTVPSGALTPPQCSNGGVSVNGACHCPSGYSGVACGTKTEPTLCDRVTCLNNGVCAVRSVNGPYESVCLCRYGTWGDYCELTGTLGSCSPGFCLNGGACIENVIGTTRHAYCRCPAGYNGAKCANRYFNCTTAGTSLDPIMHEQGKYFSCALVNGVLQAEQKSCPKGLRFNLTSKLCTR